MKIDKRDVIRRNAYNKLLHFLCQCLIISEGCSENEAQESYIHNYRPETNLDDYYEVATFKHDGYDYASYEGNQKRYSYGTFNSSQQAMTECLKGVLCLCHLDKFI